MQQPRPNPLLEILQKKWSQISDESTTQQIIVARPQAKQMALAKGFQLTPKKLRGKRITTRKHLPRLMTAIWPEDKMIESRVPMVVSVLAGQADLRCGDYVLHCEENTVIYIPPETPRMNGEEPHLEGENRLHGSCSLLMLRPHQSQLQCWICHSRGDEHVMASPDENVYIPNEKLVHLVEDIYEELSQATHFSFEIASHMITLLWSMLRRDLTEQRFVFTGAIKGNSPSFAITHDPISEAQQYIKTHLFDVLHINMIARRVHLSRSQFTKQFRSETGKTFSEFLVECRMDQAKVLLSETDFTITHISRLVGYKSTSYFFELFKQKYQVSPEKYRQNHQNKK